MVIPALFCVIAMEELYEIFKKSSGISTDTRTIAAGTLFVALKGENFDSNTMIGEALAKGAMHVVTTNKDYQDDPRATVVDDTLKTLQDLASYHREQLDIPIVGITGTNGKTTTKELTAAVLREKYQVFATKGNLNNHIGVPLSLLSIRDEDIAVIEMGASHPHEIRDLAAIVRPTAGLVTNVGTGHILGFGSFEGVKRTKAELYDQLKSTRSTIFVNATNANLLEMLGDYDRVVSYGDDPDGCFIDGHVTEVGEYLRFEWRRNNEPYREVTSNLAGAYNLENALAAVTVGCFFDVDEADICHAVSTYVPTNGRSQIIATERNRVVMDAYNANPSSMMASLENFVSQVQEHKVVVLGAMRELGNEQDEHHLELMRKLAESPIEKVFLVGEEFEKFAGQFPTFVVRKKAEELVDEVKKLSGKYILVKGSNSNKLGQLQQYL